MAATGVTLRYESYDAVDGPEWMVVLGPADGPRLLVVPPLFEELNFTRATILAMARALAVGGIGVWIMDLPGTGESLRALETVRLHDWREAVRLAAAMLGRPHVASIRGGALIDDAAAAQSWWRFAPADGAALLRQMERAQAIGDRESGRIATAPAKYVDLVGYRFDRMLRDDLRAAAAVAPDGPLRVLPFTGPGVAPWRRAEPTTDLELATTLAHDLAAWIATCGA